MESDTDTCLNQDMLHTIWNKSFNWINEDLVVFNWGYLKFDCLERETKATKYRIKIEPEDFNFKFIKAIPEELHKKLSDENYYSKQGLKMKDAIKQIKNKKKEIKKIKLEAKKNLK